MSEHKAGVLLQLYSPALPFVLFPGTYTCMICFCLLTHAKCIGNDTRLQALAAFGIMHQTWYGSAAKLLVFELNCSSLRTAQSGECSVRRFHFMTDKVTKV